MLSEGYGRLGGSKTNAWELSEILQGIERNGLLSANRLLTGKSCDLSTLADIH